MNAAQKLIREHNLTWEEFAELIKMADDPQVDALLAEEAVRIRKEVYGTDVYTRGLIEFTNYCLSLIHISRYPQGSSRDAPE